MAEFRPDPLRKLKTLPQTSMSIAVLHGKGRVRKGGREGWTPRIDWNDATVIANMVKICSSLYRYTTNVRVLGRNWILHRLQITAACAIVNCQTFDISLTSNLWPTDLPIFLGYNAPKSDRYQNRPFVMFMAFLKVNVLNNILMNSYSSFYLQKTYKWR